MKRLAAYTTVLVLMWAMWFFLCPCYLRVLEGFDFFTTLPDFTRLNLEIPKPGLMYISAFLLQFYKFPAIGALINALMILLQILCMDLVVRKLFKNAEGLWWLSLVPAVFFTGLLTKDLGLVTPLTWLAIMTASALAVQIMLCRVRPFISLPRIFGNLWLGAAVLAVSAGACAYKVYDSLVKDGREEMAQMDYLVKNERWDSILETVSPQKSRQDGYMRRCALLALTQTGRLADEAFRYGLSGSTDFYFKDATQSMYRSFNMKFYNTIGMFSPAVYYAYQLGSQFYLGMSFDSARSLADTYIDAKDYALAKKYIEILDKTTCHSKWVKEHQNRLEEIKGAEPEYVADPVKEIWGSIIYDMPSMIDRYPQDDRYRDLLLCGILADRDAMLFYEVFCDLAAPLYEAGTRMPRIYQEALIVCLSTDMKELKKYNIDEKTMEDYLDFARMIGSGKGAAAKRKYADTYWAYLYFRK